MLPRTPTSEPERPSPLHIASNLFFWSNLPWDGDNIVEILVKDGLPLDLTDERILPNLGE